MYICHSVCFLDWPFKLFLWPYDLIKVLAGLIMIYVARNPDARGLRPTGGTMPGLLEACHSDLSREFDCNRRVSVIRG